MSFTLQGKWPLLREAPQGHRAVDGRTVSEEPGQHRKARGRADQVHTCQLWDVDEVISPQQLP
jgi:hypothetical protein